MYENKEFSYKAVANDLGWKVKDMRIGPRKQLGPRSITNITDAYEDGMELIAILFWRLPEVNSQIAHGLNVLQRTVSVVRRSTSLTW